MVINDSKGDDLIIVAVDDMEIRQYLVGTLLCSLGWFLDR